MIQNRILGSQIQHQRKEQHADCIDFQDARKLRAPPLGALRRIEPEERIQQEVQRHNEKQRLHVNRKAEAPDFLVVETEQNVPGEKIRAADHRCIN